MLKFNIFHSYRMVRFACECMQTVIVGNVIGSSFGDPSRWFITDGYLKYKIKHIVMIDENL